MFTHSPILITVTVAPIGISILYLAFKFGCYWREKELDQEAIREAAIDRYFENLINAKIDLSIGKN